MTEKSTVLEWGETLPSHWRVRRLKHLCEVFPSNVDKKSYDGDEAVLLCNYTDIYYNETITERLPFMQATATREQIDRFTLKAGDTIITKDSETADDIAIPAYVPGNLPGVVCGYHLAMVRPRSGTNGAFISWWFRSKFLKASAQVRANGLTRVGLGQYALDNVEVPEPPLFEQITIAAFLDRETGKIDALVEEQKRLIELLKEKRQAAISHAVTKGLDPNARMKSSGVEWLGDVPEHWQMLPLKRITPRLTVGIVVNPSSYVSDEGFPFIYGGDIREGQIDFSSARCISPKASSENAKTMLEEGDLLTVRVGAPGITAVVPQQCQGGNCASVMLIKKGNFVSEWLNYAMNSRTVRYQVEVVQYGAAQEQFNIGHAKDFIIPVPPRSEQASIANILYYMTTKLDQLSDAASRSIDLLLERRSALISAVVTGKLDLRDIDIREQVA